MKESVIEYSKWTFSSTEIRSGKISYKISLLHSELEPNYFETEVECSDPTILDFQRNAPLKYYNGGDMIGIFYVQSIKRASATTYTIKADSTIALLNDRQHYGGIYTGQTVEDVLPSICGTIPYIIKTNLRSFSLYGYLPIATCRDNLAQVLFAIGATVKNDLDGVLHIEGLWDGFSGSVDADRMYTGASAEYASKVSQVIVTEHQYIPGENETELFNGTTQSGDVVTFSEPMHSLRATGFSILESGANYAIVSSGTGSLFGKNYTHNTRQISRNIATTARSDDSGAVKSVTDATLVSISNSLAVAERLGNYYKCAQTLKFDVVYSGEVPGNVMSVLHPYDNRHVPGCVQSIDITVSNTLKATESMLVDFLPLQNEDSKLLTERIVLTGNGMWLIPEGTDYIRYVLISGAQGGHCGQKGGDVGTSPSVSWTNPPPFENQLRGCGLANGGAGGEGGAPGAGARILEGALDISGIDSIVYSCGVGGLGASYNPNDPEGALGSDTTLGSATTAGAQASEAGYTDPITGEKYGGTGDQGIPGGKGAGKAATVTTINSDTVQLFDPAENVTDEDGNTWNGGLTETDPDDPERVAMKTRENNGAYIWYSRGLGAGAAAGKNGNGPGPDASVSVRSSSIKATAASGVNGATPTLTPKKPAQYGKGGRGGYGGGGASSGGLAIGSTDSSDYTVSITAGTGGIGGNGGTGGPGGDGCIILYISRRVPVERGPLVTSDTKWFLDKHGRRFIT